MKNHSSEIFSYDKEITRQGYLRVDSKFMNPVIENSCLDKVISALKRNSIDLGIDFNKPWEELILDEDHYQIEYLFVGKLNIRNGCIHDKEVGINILEEHQFGKEIFNSNDLLNLTLIIEKNTPNKD